MKYHVRHTTRYEYLENPTLSQNEARIVPRNFRHQTCLKWQVVIDPPVQEYRERVDYFGNRTCYFSVEQPHTCLTVTADSEVHLADAGSDAGVDPPWEDVARWARDSIDAAAVREFVLDAPLVPLDASLHEYAAKSFRKGRGFLDACQDLNGRIAGDFEYVPGFTTVSTPLNEVMRFRRGVCQDFAHVMLGCLRAMGLPARYISGYLETNPPEDTARLQGADASHAWLAVFSPQTGWVDLDPTNNVLPSDRHIIAAWGRDFNDASPLKGVVFSSGEQHLDVAVKVERVPA